MVSSQLIRFHLSTFKALSKPFTFRCREDCACSGLFRWLPGILNAFPSPCCAPGHHGPAKPGQIRHGGKVGSSWSNSHGVTATAWRDDRPRLATEPLVKIVDEAVGCLFFARTWYACLSFSSKRAQCPPFVFQLIPVRVHKLH